MFEMRYMGLPKGSSICFQPQLWYNFIDNFVDSERMFTEAVEAADDADKL